MDYTANSNTTSLEKVLFYFNYYFSNKSASIGSLQIYNTTGNLVKSVFNNKRFGMGKHVEVINTAELSNGIYMVTLFLNGKSQTKKIIISRK